MRVHLIDGSGYVFRAFYALPPLARSDGQAVNALYGYCGMLGSLVRETCTHMAVIMDGGRSGRQEIDPAYKANRPPKPPELTSQLALIQDATAAYGVASVKAPGIEADDVIATYARTISESGGECVIYSADKDLMQLLTLPGVSIYDPLKKQWVTEDVCIERIGVKPHQVTDYLSIVGDSADNIPGIPKVGKETAKALINAHGDLNNILRLAECAPSLLACSKAFQTRVANGVESALKSRNLVRLQYVDNLPPVDGLRFVGPDKSTLRAYLNSMEFNLYAHELDRAA